MRTLDFGKCKGKILANCVESYIVWLAQHEKVLAERNRWASRDAKFLLQKKAEQIMLNPVRAKCGKWFDWMESAQQTVLSNPNIEFSSAELLEVIEAMATGDDVRPQDIEDLNLDTINRRIKFMLSTRFGNPCRIVEVGEGRYMRKGA